ncbi:MAG: 3-hydroxyacyl-CoA dehydrogenase NAD-binding domain-containing protein, partial [Anaerolineae bacterium]
MKDQLLSKIHDHTAVVAVIGLGYVGLPLAVAFAEKGFPVVGIEVDGRKVAAVQRGESYVQDIPSERLAALTNDERRTMEGHQPSTIGHRLVATTDFSVLTQCDAAIIAVPTPLSKTRDPDMKYVLAAGKAVAQVVHPGMLVVLESTTYPGTTEELLLPMLCQAMGVERCAVGQQFFLAFSPERIDPGNQRYTVENTPKVVGGTTPACREVAEALYGAIIERIVPVSSTQAA